MGASVDRGRCAKCGAGRISALSAAASCLSPTAMTMTTATTLLLCLATAARAALAVSDGGYAPAYNASVRPLVIWHGMGDSANSSGMAGFAERIREMHPGIFVHSVRLADDEKDDQRAGFVCPFSAGAEQVLTHHCPPASSGM
jgi:hypothetical protein